MANGRRGARLLAAALLPLWLASGCGAHGTPASHRHQKAGQGAGQSAYAAFVAQCFPAWEQSDMRIAATAHLPVQTTEIAGTSLRLTGKTLPVWLSDPPDTPLTPQALLKGYVVHGLDATGPAAVLETVVSRQGGGLMLYIEESALTQTQVNLLDSDKAPVPGGPVTLEVGLSGTLDPAKATAKDVLGSLLTTLGTSSGGVAATLYSEVTPSPRPTEYRTPEGALDPAGLLSRPASRQLPECTAGPALLLAPSGGLLEPTAAFLAQDHAGVAYGFAPGRFVVAEGQGEYDRIYWFKENAIALPGP